MVSNVARNPFFFRTLKHYTPDARLLAYRTIVLPTFGYANFVQDPITKRNINKLGTIWIKALRLVYNKYRRCFSTTGMLRDGNIISIAIGANIILLNTLFQMKIGFIRINGEQLRQAYRKGCTRFSNAISIEEIPAHVNAFKVFFLSLQYERVERPSCSALRLGGLCKFLKTLGSSIAG